MYLVWNIYSLLITIIFLLQVFLLSNLGSQKLLLCCNFFMLLLCLLFLLIYDVQFFSVHLVIQKKDLKYLLSTNKAALTLLLFKGKIRTKTNTKFLVMLSHCYEWFGHLLYQIMAHCLVLSTGSVHM